MNIFYVCLTSILLTFSGVVSAQGDTLNLKDLVIDSSGIQQFIDKDVMASISVWDKDAIYECFDPTVLASFEKSNIDVFGSLVAFEKMFGTFTSYEIAENPSYTVGDYSGRSFVTADVVLKSECQFGKANIFLNLVNFGTEWKLLKFEIKAEK